MEINALFPIITTQFFCIPHPISSLPISPPEAFRRNTNPRDSSLVVGFLIFLWVFEDVPEKGFSFFRELDHNADHLIWYCHVGGGFC